MSVENTSHLKNIDILKSLNQKISIYKNNFLHTFDNIKYDDLFEDLITEFITHAIMNFDEDTVANLLFGVMETLFNGLEDWELYK